jgi:hypothetical protein
LTMISDFTQTTGGRPRWGSSGAGIHGGRLETLGWVLVKIADDEGSVKLAETLKIKIGAIRDG